MGLGQSEKASDWWIGDSSALQAEDPTKKRAPSPTLPAIPRDINAPTGPFQFIHMPLQLGRFSAPASPFPRCLYLLASLPPPTTLRLVPVLCVN